MPLAAAATRRRTSSMLLTPSSGRRLTSPMARPSGSRCICASLRPGMATRPARSTIFVPGPWSAAISAADPAASTLLPAIARASTKPSVRPQKMRPFNKTVSACVIGPVYPVFPVEFSPCVLGNGSYSASRYRHMRTKYRSHAALSDWIGILVWTACSERENYSTPPVPHDTIFLLAFRQHCSEY
ncbi:hypothetical protein BO1005MUT1_90041 [Hyphomicrobiales bacterium]|nr:hypothetical protein BO1005MUT1_90041 [Hyphomicrobiales bacterium]